MKTIKTIVCFLLATSLLSLTSFKPKNQPQHMNDFAIKEWVLKNAFQCDYYKEYSKHLKDSLVDFNRSEFTYNDVLYYFWSKCTWSANCLLKNADIDEYDEELVFYDHFYPKQGIITGANECDSYINDDWDITYGSLSRDYFAEFWVNRGDYYGGLNEDERMSINKRAHTIVDSKEIIGDLYKLKKQRDQYYNTKTNESISVIEWKLGDNINKTRTEYHIIYAFTQKYKDKYALISLTEFKSGILEIKVIKTSEVISDLHKL